MASSAPKPAQNPPAPRPLPRVPPAVHGVQVNHCKNPICANFRTPVADTSQKGSQAGNDYTIVATGAQMPAAKCGCCGEIFGLKSNHGVFEEAYRILAPLHGAASCPEAGCENHRIPATFPGAYHEFGKTSAGSQRYRCKACGATFSVKPKSRKPASPSLRCLVFRLFPEVRRSRRRFCSLSDA